MKSERTKAKNTTWGWMQKYVKLRDAIEQRIDPDFRYVRCCTCGKLLERGTKECQAGHYKGRSLGGSSGVYFDERNVNTQCYQCNKFKQGAPKEYEEYLIKKDGEGIIEELNMLHKVNSYTTMQIRMLGKYYKQKYEELCREYNIT